MRTLLPKPLLCGGTRPAGSVNPATLAEASGNAGFPFLPRVATDSRFMPHIHNEVEPVTTRHAFDERQSVTVS
jgi:hypothetical protein